MGQPATAGAIVAAIFGLFALAFFGYRLYRYIYWRGLQRSDGIVTTGELPMTNNNLASGGRPVTSPPPYTGGINSNRNTIVGSLYGDAYPRGTATSAPGTPYFGAADADFEKRRRRQSNLSSAFPTAANSEMETPITNTEAGSLSGSPHSDLEASKELMSSPSESQDISNNGGRPRVMSSSSSTMALKRSYAASTRPPSTYAASSYRGSSGNLAGAAGPMGERRRDSYLPHLPENRDQIQIVPPQPLGFGLGGLAQAVDQRTLAFSKTSGIGDFSDDFSRGLLWQVQQGDEEATSNAVAAGLVTKEEAARLRNGEPTHPSIALSASRTLTEEERTRYLAQGPQRSLTPTQRALIHNHIYPNSQPGSIGQRTPDIERSPRSHSPARDQWNGTGADGVALNGDAGSAASQSDIGPSVSQRGGLLATAEPSTSSTPEAHEAHMAAKGETDASAAAAESKGSAPDASTT